MRDISQQESGQKGASGHWVLPGLLAAAAGVIMILLAKAVRVPGEGNAAGTAAGDLPRLTITRLDWLPAGGQVQESLRLLDPTPLFMPTARVADADAVSEGIVDRPGGSVTETFPAALTFGDLRPSREILQPVPPRTPLAAEDFATAPRWFNGLARTEDKEAASASASSAPRVAERMDVYLRGESKRLTSIELSDDPALRTSTWQPVELNVMVNAAGLVAAPMVMVGSGVGEVDEHVRSLVKRELLPRLRLRPGVYRLVVGP